MLLAKQNLAPGLQPMSIGWDPRVLGGVLYVLRCRVTQRFSRVCSHAIKQWPQRIIPRPPALTHTKPACWACSASITRTGRCASVPQQIIEPILVVIPARRGKAVLEGGLRDKRDMS